MNREINCAAGLAYRTLPPLHRGKFITIQSHWELPFLPIFLCLSLLVYSFYSRDQGFLRTLQYKAGAALPLTRPFYSNAIPISLL